MHIKSGCLLVIILIMPFLTNCTSSRTIFEGEHSAQSMDDARKKNNR